LSINFSLEVQKNALNFSPKALAEKEKIQTFVEVLYLSSLWSTDKAQVLGFVVLSLVRDCSAR